MNLIEELKLNYFKKGTRKVEPIKVIISLVAVVFLISFYFYTEKDLNNKKAERKANLRYTIGNSGKIYKNPKSSKPTIEFMYFYNGQKYSSREHIDAEYESLNNEDKRYYVEFSYKDPENCKLLLNYPVPDSIKTAPKEGWGVMPGYENFQGK